MSTIEVNTIDSVSGTSNLTIGSSNSSQITLKSGATLTNFPDNTPAFRAYRDGSQSIPNTTATIIGINTEDFDSGGCFNHTTSTATLNGISVPAHSFAPNIAGKYVLNAVMRIDEDTDYDTNELAIYKNGSTEVGRLQWRNEASESGHIQTIVDFNGTSDYVYLRFYHGRGSSMGIAGGTNLTYFEGFRLIGA